MGNINYDKKIEELKKEIADLEQKKQHEEEMKAKTPARYLAEKLHNTCCHNDHNEFCGWYYENGNWSGYAHSSWLEKAEKMIAINKNRLSLDELVELADIV